MSEKSLKIVQERLLNITFLSVSVATLFIVLLALIVLSVTITNAKSLYVITDIDANPTEIAAYEIQGDELNFQATQNFPRHTGGAVGMAYDPFNEYIFVVYERSPVVQIIDGRNFSEVDTVHIPDAVDKAGIVYDATNGLLYVVGRGTENLYVYEWDAVAETLTPVAGSPFELENSELIGPALDEENGVLYVTDGSRRIRSYDVSDWSLIEERNVSEDRNCVGIALDVDRGVFYVGGGITPQNKYLSKCSLTDYSVLSEVYVPNLEDGEDFEGVMGIAVDEVTGYVYVTTGAQGAGNEGDRIRVFDSNLNEIYRTEDLGNPTALILPNFGYNPLNLTIDDEVPEGETALAGGTITYEICYDNLENGRATTNTVVRGEIPLHTDFVSASGGGTLENGAVVWDVGTIPGGSEGECFSLTIRVDRDYPDGAFVDMTVSITSDLFSTSNATVSTEISAPQMEVMRPNGGERWKVGQSREIHWDYEDRSVDIDFSTNDGETWINIESEFEGWEVSKSKESPLAQASYTWTVPDAPSDRCLVRVSDSRDNPISDMSDAVFTICDLELTEPTDRCCVFVECFDYEIKWNYDFVDSVYLSYSENGATYDPIAALPASEGKYMWTIPNELDSNTIFLRIADLGDARNFDEVRVMITRPTISIYKPVGGAFYGSGSTLRIEWFSHLLEQVDILYSSDAGGTWNEIANDVDALDGFYDWIVPSELTDKYLVKITNGGETCRISSCTDTFTVTDRFLKILNPNGGEELFVGSNKEIEFESNNVDSAYIYYSVDEGETYIPIDTIKIDSDPQKYNWEVPKNPSDKCLIKIVATDNEYISDLSDEMFAITGVLVTYPNGGEKILYYSDTKITWQSSGVSDVMIQFSPDSGKVWQTVEESFPAPSGFYVWRVPNEPTDDGLIRVIDTDRSVLRDASDAVFSITGILITNPSEGDVLTAGDEVEINWDSRNIDDVKVEFTSNGGDNWQTLMASIPAATGVLDWTAPRISTTEAAIRVSKIGDPSVYDMTGFFSIAGEGVTLTTPNGGETWQIGSDYDIEWLSANVRYLDIDYSTDDGATWTNIARMFDASLGAFPSWTVPAEPTTEFVVRLTDSENRHIFDISDAGNRIAGPGYAYPAPSWWSFKSNTGENATIIVPTSINPKSLGYRDIAEFDLIGVFFEENGKLKCAGYGQWNNQNLAITAWGDNSRTPEKDGFETNETYKFKVWDAREGREILASAEYAGGSSDFFYADNISVLSGLYTYRSLFINLPGGEWSMISSNLLPYDVTVESMTSEIRDNLDIMKNDLGEVYIPSEDINSIVNWNMKDGYQIYATDDETLEIKGIVVDPHDYEQILEPQKWYIVSYLPQDPMPVADAIRSIDADSLIAVKNGDGEVYYPDYGIDQIGQTVPGQGYKIAVKTRSVLDYTETSRVYPGAAKVPDETPEPIHFVPTMRKTGADALLAVESDELLEGDEVAALDENGEIVGSAVYHKGRAILTVWGDNPATSFKDGAETGEALSLVAWRKDLQAESELKIKSSADAVTGRPSGDEIVYRQDAIIIAKAEIGSTLNVEEIESNEICLKINPNPVRNSAVISFSAEKGSNAKAEICDAFGNEVVVGFETVAGGGFESRYVDLGSLPSGTYFVKLTVNGRIAVEKFAVIK